MTNSSLIFVEFSPKSSNNFVEAEQKVEHGSNFTLNCETNANPTGNVQWFFTSKEPARRKPLENTESLLTIHGMTESKQGTYECIVENRLGRLKRSFEVVDYPKGESFFKLSNFFEFFVNLKIFQ